MKAGARWEGIGFACTGETAGGSGVGPAVMRYCLMYGFAAIGAATIAGRADRGARPSGRGRGPCQPVQVPGFLAFVDPGFMQLSCFAPPTRQVSCLPA